MRALLQTLPVPLAEQLAELVRVEDEELDNVEEEDLDEGADDDVIWDFVTVCEGLSVD